MASVTSRCCAPSWRSRSSRHRSASAASTMRTREARRSASCACRAARAGAGGRAPPPSAAMSSMSSAERPRVCTSADTGRPPATIVVISSRGTTIGAAASIHPGCPTRACTSAAPVRTGETLLQRIGAAIRAELDHEARQRGAPAAVTHHLPARAGGRGQQQNRLDGPAHAAGAVVGEMAASRRRARSPWRPRTARASRAPRPAPLRVGGPRRRARARAWRAQR